MKPLLSKLELRFFAITTVWHPLSTIRDLTLGGIDMTDPASLAACFPNVVHLSYDFINTPEEDQLVLPDGRFLVAMAPQLLLLRLSNFAWIGISRELARVLLTSGKRLKSFQSVEFGRWTAQPLLAEPLLSHLPPIQVHFDMHQSLGHSVPMGTPEPPLKETLDKWIGHSLEEVQNIRRVQFVVVDTCIVWHYWPRPRGIMWRGLPVRFIDLHPFFQFL